MHTQREEVQRIYSYVGSVVHLDLDSRSMRQSQRGFDLLNCHVRPIKDVEDDRGAEEANPDETVHNDQVLQYSLPLIFYFFCRQHERSQNERRKPTDKRRRKRRRDTFAGHVKKHITTCKLYTRAAKCTVLRVILCRDIQTDNHMQKRKEHMRDGYIVDRDSVKAYAIASSHTSSNSGRNRKRGSSPVMFASSLWIV
jgi:hypothetical protein